MEELKTIFFDITMPCVIALDGPAASGKGTLATKIAQKYNFYYCESGKIYRKLAAFCLENKVNPEDKTKIIALSAKNIEQEYSKLALVDEEIGEFASKIAIYPEVRENINKFLRKIISNHKRIIIEGRDIGSVVAPFADLKLYIYANSLIRAQRRYNQLISQGKNCILGELIFQLQQRDKRDQMRKCGPLTLGEEAFALDTSDIDIEEVIEKIINFVKNKS